VIRDNLSQMIRLAQGAGARVVLAGIRMPPSYGTRYTTDFEALYPQLAKKHGVPLIPFILDGIALDRALMQGDGIHPNAAGQPKLLENAWPVLAKELL
jgi:acyl-CoA thioesterase-1